MALMPAPIVSNDLILVALPGECSGSIDDVNASASGITWTEKPYRTLFQACWLKKCYGFIVGSV